MKTYLTVKFNEKDEAKKIAKDNGTRIVWDAGAKKWYWEGETLPEFLQKYTYQTTQQAYAKRDRSFNAFMASPASDAYKKQQRQILIDDSGMTNAEYDKWEAEWDEEQKKIEEEADAEWAKTNHYVCLKSSCLWLWDSDNANESKCPDCGSKKITKT